MINIDRRRFSWQRCRPWSDECFWTGRRGTKTRPPDPDGRQTNLEPKENRELGQLTVTQNSYLLIKKAISTYIKFCYHNNNDFI